MTDQLRPVRRRSGKRLVSLIVPVFNEAPAIEPFFNGIRPALDEACRRFGDVTFEMLFVDDGSADDTVKNILAFPAAGRRVRVVSLSRNFGKEAAMTAGLAEAAGEAVIVMDVDLQDPPDLIPQMVERWRAGAKVVLARRADRSEDALRKRLTAGWFYQIHNLIASVKLPPDIGDFRLMDRQVVDEINRLPENRRFMKGLFAWVGFTPEIIDYKRAARTAGSTKFSGWRLWRLAIEGITSFSAAPLVVWSYFGLLVSALAMAYGFFVVVRTLIFGVDVPGYASLLASMLFLGGVQLIGIGVLGEYVGRIYSEVKGRPSYIIAERREIHAGEEARGAGG